MNRLILRLFGFDVVDLLFGQHDMAGEDATVVSDTIPFGFALEDEADDGE